MIPPSTHATFNTSEGTKSISPEGGQGEHLIHLGQILVEDDGTSDWFLELVRLPLGDQLVQVLAAGVSEEPWAVLEH